MIKKEYSIIFCGPIFSCPFKEGFDSLLISAVLTIKCQFFSMDYIVFLIQANKAAQVYEVTSPSALISAWATWRAAALLKPSSCQ
jgi:hypothetical protein